MLSDILQLVAAQWFHFVVFIRNVPNIKKKKKSKTKTHPTI